MYSGLHYCTLFHSHYSSTRITLFFPSQIFKYLTRFSFQHQRNLHQPLFLKFFSILLFPKTIWSRSPSYSTSKFASWGLLFWRKLFKWFNTLFFFPFISCHTVLLFLSQRPKKTTSIILEHKYFFCPVSRFNTNTNMVTGTALAQAYMLEDLKFPMITPTPIYEDNKSCIKIVNTRKPTDRIKQLEVPCSWIKDWKTDNYIIMKHIPGILFPPDLLIKPLSWVLHSQHSRRTMGHHKPSWFISQYAITSWLWYSIAYYFLFFIFYSYIYISLHILTYFHIIPQTFYALLLKTREGVVQGIRGTLIPY